MSGLNMPQYVQPAAVRHMDIEQYQVPLLLAKQIQRFVPARGLSHGVDARVRLQKLLESRPNDRVIVGDQYS
jgi:hypothetical protein